MSSSFKVYIDESGDEGFVFNADGSGSSRWFVLSAVVLRTANDLEVVKCLGDVRQLLGKIRNFPLHFVDLRHDQRKAYVAKLATIPVRTISIVAHKPSCKDPSTFQAESYLLYRYLTRLLLERVSWLCRDKRVPGEGDGQAEIVFSNRKNMSYQAIRDYIGILKKNLDVRIDWTVIEPQRVVAVAHEKLAGLQAADAVASSIFYSVTLNRFGMNEASYANTLLPTFYRHDKTLLGYGLKFWPTDIAGIKTGNPHLEELAAWK